MFQQKLLLKVIWRSNHAVHRLVEADRSFAYMTDAASVAAGSVASEAPPKKLPSKSTGTLAYLDTTLPPYMESTMPSGTTFLMLSFRFTPCSL